MKRQRRVIATMLLSIAFTAPRPALAVFGEEDWLSGQNQLLFEMLGTEMKELTQLTTLVTNARLLLRSANESLALVRTVKRAYDMLRKYRVEDLVRDAKAGLYRAFPELRDTEREARALVENGRAIEQGEGAFFSKIMIHDAAISSAARRTFEHAYQASIWPAVFPDAMSFQPGPSKVELLIQERYRRTEDQMRHAIQQTAMGVLAKKVEAFVADAEEKDNADLRAISTNTQVNFQTMQHLTELRNIEEQTVAREEATRLDDSGFRGGMANALQTNAGMLFGSPKGESP